MKLHIYTVHDKQLEAYGAPAVYTAHGQAQREFTDQVNNKESMLNKHPEDYKLYYLGEYDNATGTFTGTSPQLKANALDLIRE